MRGELFFEIPGNQEIMVKLVEAVPSTWSWVDGNLLAPERLIDSGMVEKDTGFALRRFHSIKPTIIGSYDREEDKRKKPNLYAIIVEQKLPHFLIFDEAGYEDNIVTLELVKRIAVAFLQKGYRGGLHFYKNCYDNSKYSNPASCSMIFEPWQGPPICREEAGPQPASIKLEWEGSYGGKEEDIAPIICLCRSLNLQEYLPVAPGTIIAL